MLLMSRTVLTLNLGSSSLKFSLFDIDSAVPNKLYWGEVMDILHTPHLNIYTTEPPSSQTTVHQKTWAPSTPIEAYKKGLDEIFGWLTHQPNIPLIAVGHRIAHGGTKYRQASLIDETLINDLKTLIPLAPLHQPYHIEGIKIVSALFPKLPQVACFDTSFHTTCHPLSQLFAIPTQLTESGIRRYGFHGLSYEYIVSQFDRYLPELAEDKIIIAHLGSGSTLCAVHHRQSVATSIGFSALDGLPMNTRCGTIDAGVLLYLMQTRGLTIKELETLLYKKSGWLGVSGGISADMHQLLASDSPEAKLAIDLFVYRINTWLGSLTAELNGLNGIIFTAGIGENSPIIRKKICALTGWLGTRLDDAANQRNDIKISRKESKIGIYVIPTDEATTIAKQTIAILETGS
jgi:acetate kinase